MSGPIFIHLPQTVFVDIVFFDLGKSKIDLLKMRRAGLSTLLLCFPFLREECGIAEQSPWLPPYTTSLPAPFVAFSYLYIPSAKAGGL